MANKEERLLNWLQEFYIKEVNIDELPENIDFKDIEHISSTYGMEWNNFFRIFTVGNPGWGICFNYNNTYKNNPWNRININTGVNYSEVNEENEWFSAKKDEYLFDASSGPLYLSVSLDIFRCFIEQEVPNITNLAEKRADLIGDNPLLCWLEEF